jgi:hypothetical protein
MNISDSEYPLTESIQVLEDLLKFKEDILSNQNEEGMKVLMDILLSVLSNSNTLLKSSVLQGKI